MNYGMPVDAVPYGYWNVFPPQPYHALAQQDATTQRRWIVPVAIAGSLLVVGGIVAVAVWSAKRRRKAPTTRFPGSEYHQQLEAQRRLLGSPLRQSPGETPLTYAPAP